MDAALVNEAERLVHQSDMPIALVTGGSSGLGREVARRFMSMGVGICIVARNPERLRKAVDAMSPASSIVLSASGDIGEAADVSRIRCFVEDQKCSVKWLVNVAGAPMFGDLVEMQADRVDRLVKTNLLGPIHVTRTFLDHVRRQAGAVCNVMSRAALVGLPNEAVYSATKWGVRGLTEALRTDPANRRVRFLSVFPSSMNTAFWTGLDDIVSSLGRESFIDPAEAARIIVDNLTGPTGCAVTELSIGRLK